MLDIDQASLVRAFQGRRRFQTRETAAMARILNVPLEDVLRNLDVEVPRMRAAGGTVAVVGQVQGGQVQLGPVRGARVTVAPPGESSAGLQALRYADEGPLEGAYLYFRPAAGVEPSAIGKLCVCSLVGGDVVLAVPRAGLRRDAYTLRDVVGRVLHEDAWLESAAPVVWIRTA